MPKAIPIALLEDNEEDFNLRIKNFGQTQRKYISGHDQDEPMVVLATLHDAVHSRLKEDELGEPQYTLAVFDFDFPKRQGSKRFKEVRIKIIFATEAEDTSYDPHVLKLAPDGTFHFLETTQSIEMKSWIKYQGDPGKAFGVSLGGETGRETTTSVTLTDYIKVTGHPRIESAHRSGGLNYPNAVEWNLFENATQKSGVCTSLRTAVLLKRKGDDTANFTATFLIGAKIDFTSDLAHFLKVITRRIPQDDPVIFDPNEKPTTKDYDPDDLLSIDLEKKACSIGPHVGQPVDVNAKKPGEELKVEPKVEPKVEESKGDVK